MSTGPSLVVPDGFTLHTENTSHLLLSSNEAFLNPVQEFNRDLSVACIRTWSEELNLLKETRWKQAQEKKAGKANARKRQKVENGDVVAAEPAEQEAKDESSVPQKKEPQYKPYKPVILEALSATGLRSIRYAKEIPLVKYVIANDLSSAATAAMKRNVEFNGFDVSDGKIRINEGDACTLMYNHREERQRVDVVDLDPYGTAAPFIDAAVQCVNDGGLLCVTCTDLSVLATNNYPEKCLSNYGGIPVKAEYCHEAALRLVLHALSTSASRYGRYIEPLLSLSIDFYVRLFVKVHTSAIGVKKALTKTSAYFVCTSCQSFYEQPLGRVTEKKHEASGNINYNFRTHPGPVVSDRCPECESALHIAGPMWSGPIHDTDFVAKVLEYVEENPDSYGTSTRMKGMLTVAKEELHTPFYFTPTRVASFFHCQTPSLDEVASALLHAGYSISRSHATPGSLKTTATRADLYDIFRSFVKLHPVKLENVSETSPARKLLAKEPKTEANFKRHPQSVTASSKVKLVRYQETPQNWGPGSRAVTGTGSKRKRKAED
ncbi:tRNA methyltransferase [Armillaria luteobubalina]|uniref:tRNA (guanine(26)-N(2))-dimethyltransferase n=1 Tax=Armillaria luteobubalina TaxID=153913 RepID=A0AA39QJ26_9AGAR|nr:tRNA methyltransferase [Armillaria luteobubalina]